MSYFHITPCEWKGRQTMLVEFRNFIARGYVLELAVAVSIGSAFATITKSLTDDIIMPVVGYIFGGVDFSCYFNVLGDIPPGFKGAPTNYAALKAAGVAMFGLGEFLTVVKIGRASCRERVCQYV